MLRAGVHSLAAKEALEASRELAAAGARVIFLPANIRDKASLISGVRATAPLDPPLTSETNWDAFEDSLWEGLRRAAETTIVLVWPRATTMAISHP